MKLRIDLQVLCTLPSEANKAEKFYCQYLAYLINWHLVPIHEYNEPDNVL